MAQRSITPRPLGDAVAVPDPTQALVGSVRRTTVVTRDLQASLRFWRDGLGYAVWYDGRMRTWPVPGYGYRPGSRVRVVVLASPQHATEPAAASTSGMIGLLSLLDEQPAGVPPAPDGQQGAEQPAEQSAGEPA